MSPSAQLTSEQLTEITEDEKKTNKRSREVREHVEDGEEVLNPDNCGLLLNTILNTINNEFEHEFLDEQPRQQNAPQIHRLKADRVPRKKYSIPGMPRTIIKQHQVWAIWFSVRRWV